MSEAFEVDVAELRAVVAAMTAHSAALGDLVDDVESAAASLHAEWSGLARDAHVAAHTSWSGVFGEMQAALVALQTTCTTAGDNYTAAVEANVAMWEQVR